MGLIEFLVGIAIFGLIVWLIVTYIPMPEPFKTVIIVIAVIVLLLIFLRWVLPGFTVRLPTLR